MIKSFTSDVKKTLKNKSGYILLNVILIFVILTIIVVTLSMSALSNHKAAQKSSEHNAAYYYAESGLNEFVDGMIFYINGLSETEKSQFQTLSTQEIVDKLEAKLINDGVNEIIETSTTLMNEVAIRIVNLSVVEGDVDRGDEIIIKSTGLVGTNQRSVERSILNIKDQFKGEVPAGLCISTAMLVEDSLTFAGGTLIDGKIKLLNPQRNAIKFSRSGEIVIRDSVLWPKSQLTSNQIIENKDNSYKMVVKENGKDTKLPITIDENALMETLPAVSIPALPKDKVLLMKNNIIPVQGSGGGTVEIVIEKGTPVLKYPGSKVTLDLKSYGKENSYVYIDSIKQTNKDSSVIYIDVGDKTVNLVINESVIRGSILIKGSGNLRVHFLDGTKTNFDPYKFRKEEMTKDVSLKDSVALVFHNKAAKANTIKLTSPPEWTQPKGHKANYIFSLMGENHNLTFSEGVGFDVNIALLGKNNELFIPTRGGNGFTAPNPDYEAGMPEDQKYLPFWDLFFVPDGTIKYNLNMLPEIYGFDPDFRVVPAQFTGSMLAQHIYVGNTGAKLSFTSKMPGSLPDEFNIFNPQGCKPGGGNDGGTPGPSNTGKFGLGPIREVHKP